MEPRRLVERAVEIHAQLEMHIVPIERMRRARMLRSSAVGAGGAGGVCPRDAAE